MALLETITLGVSASVAKLVIKLAMPEGSARDAIADSASKLLERRISDFTARRKAERLLDEVQDEVSKRLVDAFNSEFPELTHEDKEAASIAVAELLASAPMSELAMVSNLDGGSLYRRVLDSDTGRIRSLGGDVSLAANFLLKEVCVYTVSVAEKFPDFRSALARELLQRSDQIRDDLVELIARVDDLRSTADTDKSKEASTFETDYKRLLVNQLDRLYLFGLRQLNEATSQYPLTVSYISLAATIHGVAKPTSVEDALGGRRRILLRGEAGSGKSTLLQWLAVHGAIGDFGESLSDWRHRLPFYLRLRDYVAQVDFPRPEEYLKRSWASNLAGAMPPKWVHDCLQRGALVLLDGFDELPSMRRRAFLTWLKNLIEQYPQCTYVVSSRPAALDALQDGDTADEYLSRSGFEKIALEPLSLRDIENLVVRWHQALGRENATEIERDQLEAYSLALRHAFRVRRPLRSLATSPLLCAMTCALNWHLKQHLPSNRMELYRLALEMLIEQRDAARSISTAGGVSLSLQAKQSVLDALAYWMLKNGRTEAHWEEALTPIANAMKRLPNLSAQPEEVLQELLERSGVLRQPQFRTIDFVHRTFLEYMGARAAIEEQDLGFLAQMATTDSWRETIIFAAGHAKGTIRDKFIALLLGKSLMRRRSIELDVTAACCLETASEGLDDKVYASLRECARRLFPPRNFDQARDLAPAAELDPSLLVGHGRSGDGGKTNAETVAACIRCAAISGGEKMMDVIASYSAITSQMEDEVIRNELVRAWGAFDVSEYREKVIGSSPWMQSLFDSLKSPNILSGETMQCLEFLVLRNQFGVKSGHLIEVVNLFHSARELRLSASLSAPMPWTDVISHALEVNHWHKRFRANVARSITVNDARIIASLTTLKKLEIEGNHEEGVLNEILRAPSLKGLSFTWSASQWVDAGKMPSTISWLAIDYGDRQAKSKKGRPTDLRWLAGLPELETLWLSGFPALAEGMDIALPPSVRTLDVDQAHLSIFERIAGAKRLEALHIGLQGEGSHRLDLFSFSSLRELYIQGSAEMSLALVLPAHIEKLVVVGFRPSLVNADALRNLKEIQLESVPEFVRAEALVELPALELIVSRLSKAAVSSEIGRKLTSMGVQYV